MAMNVFLTGKVVAAFSIEYMLNSYKLQGTILDSGGNPVQKYLLLMQEQNQAPGNVLPPNYRQVRIARSNMMGLWAFRYLEGGRYTVIAYDQTGNFDPAIKGGLIAEPME